MSVRTTADEKLDEAKEAIKVAYKSLIEFLDEGTFGHDEYKKEFIMKVHEVAAKLIELKGQI